MGKDAFDPFGIGNAFNNFAGQLAPGAAGFGAYLAGLANGSGSYSPMTYSASGFPSSVDVSPLLGAVAMGPMAMAGGAANMLNNAFAYVNAQNNANQQAYNAQDLQKEALDNALALGKGSLDNQSQALANQVAMQKTGLGGLQNILGGVFGKGGIGGLFNGLGSSLGGLLGGGSGGSPGGGTNAFSGFAAPLITGFQSTNGPQSASLNLAGAGGPAAATSFSNSPSVNPSGSPFTGGAGAPDPRMIAQQNARAVPPGQLPLYQTVAGLGGSPAYA